MQKKKHLSWKEKCIEKFRAKKVPESVISAFQKAETKVEYNRILDKFPPIFLLEMKIRKSEFGDDYLCKNSIKTIKTR